MTASQRDYELVRQALLRRHDLDPDGLFDAETDEALVALERLAMSIGPAQPERTSSAASVVERVILSMVWIAFVGTFVGLIAVSLYGAVS